MPVNYNNFHSSAPVKHLSQSNFWYCFGLVGSGQEIWTRGQLWDKL